MAEAEIMILGFLRRLAMPWTRLRVPMTRLSRMRRLTSWVQRWATGSPARWMTASVWSRLSWGGGPCMGSQTTQAIPGARLAAGWRLRTVREWPARCRSARRRRPMSPLAPVSVIFTASAPSPHVRWSHKSDVRARGGDGGRWQFAGGGYNKRTDASLESRKTIVGLSDAAGHAGRAAGGVYRRDHG